MVGIVGDFVGSSPPAFSAMLYAFDNVADEEGRPLGERRAATGAKSAVPMELKPCPYSDLRVGQPMNVSALKQVMRHQDAVLEEICSFQRALRRSTPPWDRLVATVLHLLAGPATFLVQKYPERPQVPVRLAVGYKLAAGYFSALRDHAPLEGSTEAVLEAFLASIDARRMLIGASEVCSGPPHLIRATALRLLRVPPEEGPKAEPSAVIRVLHLMTQIRLGASWRDFDAHIEDVLLRQFPAASLVARSKFLQAEVTRARSATAPRWSWCPRRALSSKLEDAGTRVISDASDPWLPLLKEASGCPEAAWVATPEWAPQVLEVVLTYVRFRAAMFLALRDLEQGVRRSLGVSDHVSFSPGPLILPKGRALRWVEAILGMRVDMGCSRSGGMTVELRNHRRRVALPNPSVSRDAAVVSTTPFG